MEKEIMQSQYQQTLLKAQLEIQEQTFNNISTEIHDNVGQLLSLAKMQVSIIDQSADTDKSLLFELKQNIGQALTDLRDIAKSLSGERTKMLGLQLAIQQEIDRIQRGSLFNASVVVNGQVYRFNEHKELILVRIVQEALQNIIKHSGAKNITVAFDYLTTELKLTITDDGKGFEKKKINGSSGLGLQNITNRAIIMGGSAVIESELNKGTQIKLSIPYE